MEFQVPSILIVASPESNRSIKRGTMQAYTPLMGPLVNLEFAFYKDLFDPSIDATYQEIYIHYLDIWKRTVESLKFQHKKSNVVINEGFFSYLFSPDMDDSQLELPLYPLFITQPNEVLFGLKVL